MDAAVQIIRDAVTGDAAAPLVWTDLAQAIAAVGSGPLSPEAESALVELLTPANTMHLASGHVPHSQSPQDMVRAAAIDVLSRQTGQKYAALCREVAQGPVSPIVKRLVASRFGASAAKAAEQA